MLVELSPLALVELTINPHVSLRSRKRSKIPSTNLTPGTMEVAEAGLQQMEKFQGRSYTLW